MEIRDLNPIYNANLFKNTIITNSPSNPKMVNFKKMIKGQHLQQKPSYIELIEQSPKR